jgi:hypothetical protein
MAAESYKPDTDQTPMPFAGMCEARGWKKVIERNPHASMLMNFAEVLSNRQNSVQPDTNQSSIHVDMSRVELSMYALERLINIGTDDDMERYEERIEQVFMNFLDDGFPEEWIQMFEILANKEICVLPDLREKMLQKLCDNITETDLFHMLVDLMRIIIEKRGNLPEDIQSEGLLKIVEKLRAISDIEDISYSISLKLKGIDW